MYRWKCIKMSHRETPCDVCGGEIIYPTTEFIETPTGIDESYEERCMNCDNLLYGILTKIK